jgi:hypothetical protein
MVFANLSGRFGGSPAGVLPAVLSHAEKNQPTALDPSIHPSITTPLANARGFLTRAMDRHTASTQVKQQQHLVDL